MGGKAATYTPERFALVYPPLKARGLSQREIAAEMGIAPRTLRSYLANDKYAAQSAAKMPVELEAVRQEAVNHSAEIMELGFLLHKVLIKRYQNAGETERAAAKAREALAFVRTEADLQRVFAAVNVNVDARQQALHVGGCAGCMKEEATKLLPLLCPRCRVAVIEAEQAAEGQDKEE